LCEDKDPSRHVGKPEGDRVMAAWGDKPPQDFGEKGGGLFDQEAGPRQGRAKKNAKREGASHEINNAGVTVTREGGCTTPYADKYRCRCAGPMGRYTVGDW